MEILLRLGSACFWNTSFRLSQRLEAPEFWDVCAIYPDRRKSRTRTDRSRMVRDLFPASHAVARLRPDLHLARHQGPHGGAGRRCGNRSRSVASHFGVEMVERTDSNDRKRRGIKEVQRKS